MPLSQPEYTWQERLYFHSLPKRTFTFDEAMQIAGDVGMDRIAVQHWLLEWPERGILENPSRRVFRRVDVGCEE